MSSLPPLPDERTFPASPRAALANEVVEALQLRFKERLEQVAARYDDPGFAPIDWLRDQGRHGGGRRFATANSPIFNRASINVSVVHYDDLPEKRLSSATALSTIIHPQSPHAPSMHMHISWTEMRDGNHYWRIMADLNPALAAPTEKARFDALLRSAADSTYQAGADQGDRYFFIPALQRHRGVSHFYLEGYKTDDLDADLNFARSFGEAIIDGYAQILDESIKAHSSFSPEERAEQLAYHTVYLFQVLTLDRGTTSGLLVHDQNDVGILASLPAVVDRDLLASWIPKMPPPQEKLLQAIVDTLPEENPTPVSDPTRARLCQVVREHYKKNPEALQLQASGDIIPPTVQNHR